MAYEFIFEAILLTASASFEAIISGLKTPSPNLHFSCCGVRRRQQFL